MSGKLTHDEQIDYLQKEYEQWEAGVKDDMGEKEGEDALDAGAWCDGARTTAEFAPQEISLEARNEWLRRQGLGPIRSYR